MESSLRVRNSYPPGSQIFIVIALLIVQCEGEPEIGDYIVDCSACNANPVQGVSSYSCKVRCEATGKIV